MLKLGLAATRRACPRIGRFSSTAVEPALPLRTKPLGVFQVEQYFGWYEAAHSLSDADCDSLQMSEVLEMADEELRDEWENLSLAYPFHVRGHPALVHEISKQYSTIEPQFAPESINVTVPQEGIFLAMHALVKSGDHVIVTAPAYQSLYEVAKSIGATVTHWEPEVETDPATGVAGFRFCPDRLASLMRPNTKLVRATDSPRPPHASR
jgi:aspartate/methionine/tyrosine aminotransferase